MEADFIWLFSIAERRGATDASDRYFESQCFIAKSEEGEWVLIKKGIGFGRKIGDPINERDVESVYQKI